jgi:hypothetical protein
MTHNAVLAVISLLAEKWPCCFSSSNLVVGR